MEKRIAIVGASFRFPSSPDNTIWNNLVENKDLVTHVEEGRWSFDAYQHPDKKHPGTSYTFAAGSIGDVSSFDASFFGISPREASLIDPQQRILLELAWEAIESSGHTPSSIRGSDCGVFIGISGSDYAYRFAEDLTIGDSSISTGNTTSIAANRISYLFDLHGPSLAVDTACSSSMVAFHQACQAIRTGEIEQALTGGICLHLHPYGFIAFSKATMLSPTGRCQVFDAAADGYVRSEGGGLFFLKDYEAALRDGDDILALVAGSSVNTDGYKSGLTLPNPDAQASLMAATYKKAGISAEQLDYIEAHGTGTAVGDPIETRAISMALGEHRSTPLPIGSIKSNLGHMETASGVAGLAKALYSLKHRLVPATISMKTPNPNILFDEWNIRVVTENMPLPKEGLLTIGVNSFGFGGANAHVILQSPPQVPAAVKHPLEAPEQNLTLPLIVSARDSQALQESLKQTITLLELDDASFYDTVYHYFFRKERHSIAHVIWATDTPNAIRKLKALITEETPPFYLDKPSSDIAFVYSGNGCQWETMGRSLLSTSETFRAAIEKVDAIFQPLAGYSLIDELSGINGRERFAQTEIAQPALFALQVGITEVLKEQMIFPRAVTGHSVGEVAAAWASGALSLEDAVHVIYYRSKYQGLTAGLGEMTAAGLDADTACAWLKEHSLEKVELAGVNSFKGITLAGDPEQLSTFETLLKEQDIFYRRLNLNYAFHSSAMDSVKSQVIDSLAKINAKVNTLPFYSTVTGELLSGSQLGASYWWDNIRKPVQFQSAIEGLINEGMTTFIEVGAHPVLKSYLNDALKNTDHDGLTLGTINKNNDSLDNIERTLSSVIINMTDEQSSEVAKLFPVTGKIIATPAYPWQREHFWHKITAEASGMLTREKQHPLLGYPVKQMENTWENTLDTGAHPWLVDHAVGDNVVFPGAGFAELMFAAIDITAKAENPVIELEEFEIKTPLLLDDNSCKKIRVSLHPDSGHITVNSREYVNGEAWSENATGRYLKAPTNLHLSDQAPSLPAHDADFTLSSHLELNRAAGLNYGPAFQTISHGWVNNSDVVAVFTPQLHPEYTLHPGQLDCAFQLIIHFLKDQIAANQGIAYVPTRIGRIFVRTGEHKLHLAKASLLKRSPHSITAEFSLFDENGVQIAALKEARFRAVRVNKSAAQRVDFLDYHLTAAPAQIAGSLSLPSITAQISDTLTAASLAKSQQYTQEIEPLFEALSSAFVYEALSKLEQANNLTHAYKEQLSLSSPDAGQLFAYIIHYALERDMIKATEQKWQVVLQSSDDTIHSEVIWQMMARDYPDYFFITQTLGRFGIHLEELLNAERSCEQLGLDVTAYGELLKARQNSLIINDISSQLFNLLEQLKGQKTGQRVRILEAGIESPEFARHLCAKLDFTRSDYTFCSLNQDAIEKAEHLQEDYPLLRTQSLLDVDADNSSYHQLVIINLNGACQNDLGVFMRHLELLIDSNAMVLLIAPTPADWIDLLMAGNAQWWPEQNSQQHSANEWLDIFASFGLQNLQVIESYDNSCVSVICGQAPAKETALTAGTTAQSWLIIHDENKSLVDESKALLAPQGTALQLQNISTQALAETDPTALLSTWTEQYAGKTENILFLSGLDECNNIEQLSSRCKALNTLFNAVQGSAEPMTLWVITQGVASTYPCDDPQAQFNKSITADDAALWGFARTLMNEASQAHIRLIDLTSLPVSANQLSSLHAEYLNPSNELELFLDQQGCRYAPRLRKESLERDDQETLAVAHKQDFYLGFELPGQLKNLHWFTKPTPIIAEHDIRVDIKATGLNFRDIMYTLGLLSDEAIENGFAGPTLGFEFAGEVTEVGSAVQDYKAGDLVVGFGPASFSNSVITQASAIAHIPQGISFEAAATIPSTFFTVYYAMHYLGRVEPGEKVLIHGAAGGVGIAAIQIAQWLGAEIYATVGSDSKRDFLKMMGVEHIYDSRSLTYAEEILLATDERGVDVVLNSLAGEAINQNFRVLKPFGRFLELGKRDFYENTQIGLRPFRNNISYFGIDADQLMQEKPVLTHRLFQEMMQLFKDEVLFPLPYTRFDANHVVEAFRFMQQAKQIGKIVVSYEQEVLTKTSKQAPQNKQLNLSENASYLVTGGLGGFGLKTAQWLVSLGAKNLVLISRSGAGSDEAKNALAEFKQQGVNVMAASCDVSDRDALSALLAKVAEQMPPLKGLVHAAAVIEDSLAANLSNEQIDRVLIPKIAGAKWLDELTDSLELEFFVLYSSATTLLGNPGQSSYVAANHWLEALTANRRLRGKPATCPRWGAIDDVGFLARNEKIKDALQSRIGGKALASDIALNALEQMILNNVGSMGVLEFDWGPLNRFLPTSDQAKFREVALSSNDSDNEDDNRLELSELLAMSDAELTDTVLALLTSKLSQILMISEEKLDINRSMYDMGLDSLMGVELMSAIESTLGVTISVMALSETPTLTKLSARLVSQLRGEHQENDDMAKHITSQHMTEGDSPE